MATSEHTVDAWRFAGSFLKGFLSKGIPNEPNHPPIPWTPASKPLSECKVALLTTAGISMKSDEPFDMEYERQNPTKGDGSWRALAGSATTGDVEANHLHIDTSYVDRDLNVALPLDRLRALEADGTIGAVAETHYSIMGFQGNDSSRLVEESAPEIAESMRNEEVDLALLAPV